MIGRGALGNPWLIKELDNYFNGREKDFAVSDKEKIDMIKFHFDELLNLKGEKIAVLEMRTLAGWYVKGMKNTKEFKIKLTNVKTKEEFLELVESLYAKSFDN